MELIQLELSQSVIWSSPNLIIYLISFVHFRHAQTSKCFSEYATYRSHSLNILYFQAGKENLAKNFHTSPNSVGNHDGMNIKHVANKLCDVLIPPTFN